MAKTELELLKYDCVDSQHMLFKPGCFGNIAGRRVMLCLDYDIDKIVTTGVLFERDNAIWVDVGYLAEEFKGWEACVSFTVKYPLEESANGAFVEISKAQIHHVLGFVRPGLKIH